MAYKSPKIHSFMSYSGAKVVFKEDTEPTPKEEFIENIVSNEESQDTFLNYPSESQKDSHHNKKSKK